MSAQEFMPEGRSSVRTLKEAAKHCRGCDLYANATQTVFGKGPAEAALMLVGEQPGDAEDQTGQPFIGPAGKLLDRALKELDLQREHLYITNVVKHFKWEPRGKLRLHKNPSAREVAACRPWLEAEIAAVQPTVVVCLGATAARALLGAQFRVTRQRGELHPGPNGCTVTATVHPSSIVRIRDQKEREQAVNRFVTDLRAARTCAGL
ncbi:MAG TPA: UdgX family uracil-DNA binding protein [Acidimicrobiales bacterium]|nr:UdgX family uracil-DNA binding protein [Acidimicrobiales bacterium]